MLKASTLRAWGSCEAQAHSPFWFTSDAKCSFTVKMILPCASRTSHCLLSNIVLESLSTMIVCSSRTKDGRTYTGVSSGGRPMDALRVRVPIASHSCLSMTGEGGEPDVRDEVGDSGGLADGDDGDEASGERATIGVGWAGAGACFASGTAWVMGAVGVATAAILDEYD